MPQLIATAAIVLVVAALSVYGPVARPRRPAHLREGEPTPVPQPQLGTDSASRIIGVLRTRPWARMALTTVSVGLLVAAVAPSATPSTPNPPPHRPKDGPTLRTPAPRRTKAYRNPTSAPAPPPTHTPTRAQRATGVWFGARPPRRPPPG